MNEEILESVKMRHALTDIAKEIQKFNCSEIAESGTVQYYDLFKKINRYKLNLKIKKKQMNHLNKSLRILQVVAKLLVSSQGRDSQTVKIGFMCAHTNLTHTISSCDSCLLKWKQNILCEDKHTDLEKLINNSYLALQKNYSNVAEDFSVERKLQKIFFYCQHNWANFCTERSKCEILEQRNRFLTNKINILESNLKAMAETQKNFRNLRFTRENNKMKYIEPQYKHSENAEIEGFSDRNNYIISNEIQNMNAFEKDPQYTEASIPLKRHLILVKSILLDQNCLLKELRDLSEALDEKCT